MPSTVNSGITRPPAPNAVKFASSFHSALLPKVGLPKNCLCQPNMMAKFVFFWCTLRFFYPAPRPPEPRVGIGTHCVWLNRLICARRSIQIYIINCVQHYSSLFCRLTLVPSISFLDQGIYDQQSTDPTNCSSRPPRNSGIDLRADFRRFSLEWAKPARSHVPSWPTLRSAYKRQCRARSPKYGT